MPITTHCPKCNALFRLPDELAGRKVKCRNCTTVFSAPTVSEAEPVEEEIIQANLLPDEDPVPAAAGLARGARAAGAPVAVESAAGAADDEPRLARRSRAERRREPYPEPPARRGVDPWVLVGIIGGSLILVGSIVAVLVLPEQAPPPMMFAVKPAPPIGFAPGPGGGMGGGPPIMAPPVQNVPPLDVGKAIKISLDQGAYKGKHLLGPGDQTDPSRRQPCKLFLVPLEAGKTYLIDQIAPVQFFDSYLRLENPQGQEVARDDDGGGFPNARIRYTADQTAEYRVIATSLGGGQGEFTLQIRDVERVRLNAPGTAKGVLSRDDPQVFNLASSELIVRLDAGSTYRFECESADFKPHLRLAQERRQVVATAQPPVGDKVAFLYRANRTADFYLLVAAIAGGKSDQGSYTVTVEKTQLGAAAPKIAAPKIAAPKIAKNSIRSLVVTPKKEGQASDELTAEAEPKQYSFVALSNALYTIHVKAEGFVPYVRILNKNTGDLLQEARAKAGESDLEFTFQPTINGFVRVDVAADDKKAGRFTLNIRR